MLVHIALKLGQGREIGAGVSDCVHRALNSAFDPAGEGYFQIVTEQVLEVMAGPPQSLAESKGIAVVVVIYPKTKYNSRKKRALFGRIGETLTNDLQIRKEDVVIGIMDPQEGNWFYGCDQMKLEQMMAGQLP
jgi:phenylpyruvate tautomerase PptA (4-oxalocrotonate tautomerase family)